MRKKTIVITTVVVLLVMIATISMVSANSDHATIRSAFDALNEKLYQFKKDKTESSVVAKADGIKIDKETFTFYRSNVELTYGLRGDKNIPTAKQLLEKLITDELTVQEAFKQGVIVSEKEINEAIAYQRNVYENETPNTKEAEWVLELMKNRIRITGMTDDEFWNSDLVRNGYKRAILISNYMNQMISDGTIKDMQEFFAYKKELFDNAKNRIEYNEELLKR